MVDKTDPKLKVEDVKMLLRQTTSICRGCCQANVLHLAYYLYVTFIAMLSLRHVNDVFISLSLL